MMTETDSERRRAGGGVGGARGLGARRGVWLGAAALAAALYVAVRLWRLDASCLWFDEIFGFHAAAWHGWRDSLRFVALDLIHPPLFYLLLKVWIAATGASSVWWLRLLPVVASVLALVPVALLARELRLGARATALAVLLMAASGTLIKYAQELRMYALVLPLAAGSLWLFARYCDPGRRAARAALPLAVVNLLLVYTHYFGWLLVLLEFAYLLLFARGRRGRAFVASALLLAAAFVPWAWAVVRAALTLTGAALEQNLGWAPRPGLRDLFVPFLSLNEPFRAQLQSNQPRVLTATVVLTAFVFGRPLYELCRRVYVRRRPGEAHDITSRDGSDAATPGGGDATALHDGGSGAAADDAGGATAHEAGGAAAGPCARERRAVTFLLFFSFAPVVAAFALASLLPQSVWGTRHLIIVAPPYLLLCAHALAACRPRWFSVAAHALLGVWLLLAGASMLARRPAPPVWCSWETLAGGVARESTAAGAAAAGAVAGAPAATEVYAFEDLVAYQLWYALRRDGAAPPLRVNIVPNFPDVYDDGAFFLPRGFRDVRVEFAESAMTEPEFWIAFRAAGWDEAHPVLQTLRARGYQFERRYEAATPGQAAFVVLVRRNASVQ